MIIASLMHFLANTNFILSFQIKPHIVCASHFLYLSICPQPLHLATGALCISSVQELARFFLTPTCSLSIHPPQGRTKGEEDCLGDIKGKAMTHCKNWPEAALPAAMVFTRLDSITVIRGEKVTF